MDVQRFYWCAAQQTAIYLTSALNQRVCVWRVSMCIRQWEGQHWCVLMGLGSTLPFLSTLLHPFLTHPSLSPTWLFFLKSIFLILLFSVVFISVPLHVCPPIFSLLTSLLIFIALITPHFHSQSFFSLISPPIFLFNKNIVAWCRL